METAQQRLDQIMADLTSGASAGLTKMPEGQYLVAAAADPDLMVTIEAVRDPDRIVLQALIGSLSTVEGERLARAALVLSATSAVQGGPAVGLHDESRTLIAIRAIPIALAFGEVGEAIALFIAQAVDLKAALAAGSILAMVRGEEAQVDETMIRI
jgi:hypothetical protein